MVETLLAIGIVASVLSGSISVAHLQESRGATRRCWYRQKTTAAALMTFFVFLGGWTIGRNVMDTLSEGIITIDLTLTAGVAVLFFIGLGILIAKIFGVPSMMMGQAVGLSSKTTSVKLLPNALNPFSSVPVKLPTNVVERSTRSSESATLPGTSSTDLKSTIRLCSEHMARTGVARHVDFSLETLQKPCVQTSTSSRYYCPISL